MVPANQSLRRVSMLNLVYFKVFHLKFESNDLSPLSCLKIPSRTPFIVGITFNYHSTRELNSIFPLISNRNFQYILSLRHFCLLFATTKCARIPGRKYFSRPWKSWHLKNSTKRRLCQRSAAAPADNVGTSLAAE